MVFNNLADIPLEVLYNNSIVQGLLDKLDNADLESEVKLPYIVKNKILMSPGIWNGYYYSADSIKDAFSKTSWDKKEIRSLFLDHQDLKSAEWVGEVRNITLNGEEVRGDLVIVDKPTAIKLAYGAKMGISPKVSGMEDSGKMIDFKFDNFSVVINPAVKTAYINNQEVNKMSEEKKDSVSLVEAKAEVTKVSELSDDMIEALSEAEKQMAGQVGGVMKKAKEIVTKNPDIKWADAIKQAAKEMAETYKKPEEVKPKEEPVQEEMKCKKDEVKMEDIVANVLAALEKKKYPMPQECSEQKVEAKPVEAAMSEELIKANKTIQELSEKFLALEKKFNEPDRVSVKTEELSQIGSADPDTIFLGMLNSI